MSKTIKIDTPTVQGQWPLPYPSERIDWDDPWECDWEDQKCPVCNRDLDKHDNRTITRCATA